MLLRGFGYAAFLIGMFLNVRLWRTICQLIDECRADDPSRRFSRFWWIGAWRYHRRRFPESGLRRKIVLGYALICLSGLPGFVLVVAQHLRGRSPH
jgi:hypothetical protein